MKEITEDYCNLEVSRLLKLAGFRERCGALYITRGLTSEDYNGEWKLEETKYNLDWNACDNYISCPTIQRAKKWVREKYKLHVDVNWDIDLDWYFQVKSMTETVQFDFLESRVYHAQNETGFDDEDVAANEALLFVLKKWAVPDSDKTE